MDFENTAKTIQDYAERFIEVYRGRLEDFGYENGKLYKTLNYSISNEGIDWVVTIHLEDYWKYIENGRRPGAKMPPVEAIKKWIEYKKILPRPIQLKSGKTVIPSTQQLAFVIARSIGKNGIEARPIARETVDQLNNEFVSILKSSIQRDIHQYLENQSS